MSRILARVLRIRTVIERLAALHGRERLAVLPGLFQECTE